MTTKSVEGEIVQLLPDGSTTVRIPLMLNSFSKYKPPFVRVLHYRLSLDVKQVRLWAAGSFSECVLFRWPLSVKVPSVKFDLSMGAQGVIMPCVESDVSPNFPLIACDDIGITWSTLNTGRSNVLNYQLFFEEVTDPSELELTKAVWM